MSNWESNYLNPIEFNGFSTGVELSKKAFCRITNASSGELPDFVPFKEQALKVRSQNEVMVSTFLKDKKKRYFVTNLSSVYSNEVSIELEKGDYTLVQGKEKSRFNGMASLLLGPGEAAYLMQND